MFRRSKMAKKGIGIRTILILLTICALMISTAAVAFADESSELLRDKGVSGINEAYECTVDTTREDAVKTRAGLSSSWNPIRTSLAYISLPNGLTAANGQDGLWTYCIDMSTSTVNGHKYSVTTLEEAQYYEKAAAKKLRAVLMNSYPHKSLSELEKMYGLTGLTKEEACAATQWVIWYYSNPDGQLESGDSGIYYDANVYNPATYSRSTMEVVYYDENENGTSEYSSNIVKLAKCLAALDPAKEYETEPAELAVEKRVYRDKVVFDYSDSENLEALTDIDVSVTDSEGNSVPFDVAGDKIVVKRTAAFMKKSADGLSEETELAVKVAAKQSLEKDAYFFSPEGGRSMSQSRVGVYEGTVPVATVAAFSLAGVEFDKAPLDAQLEVTKEVLLKGEAHRAYNTYYVALFADKECTKLATNGDVREIKMGGESIGTVIFDELENGKTYYVAETDANGKPLKAGDQGIEIIAYDKESIVAEVGKTVNLKISNCYNDEEFIEDGGGIGDGEDVDKEKSNVDNVDTGDNFMMVLWIVIALVALIVIAIALTKGRK